MCTFDFKIVDSSGSEKIKTNEKKVTKQLVVLSTPFCAKRQRANAQLLL